MKIYADYQFYEDNYHGLQKESEFGHAVVQASQYIRYVTLGKSDNYAGDELKYATCVLVDAYISAYKMAGGLNSSGQKRSEITDGYSVSYTTQIKDGESAEELFKRKAYPLVVQWLMPTGLLSRKVGYPHGDKHRHDYLSPST